MRIAFVSGTWPYRWAPTEWLWGQCAGSALAGGHHVLASVFTCDLPSELLLLKKEGLKVHLRRFVKPLSLQRRVDRWFFPFGAIVRFEADVVVLIQAGIDDFAVNYSTASIAQLMRNWGCPFVLLCNFNDDAYVPSIGNREAGRELFGRAARIVTFSLNNITAYRRQLALPLPRGRVLKNPLNIPSTDAVPWPVANETSFGYVGRLDARQKGLDLLLEALGTERWRDRPWHLNLYGDGPDRHYLAELAALYGISERLTFHGYSTDIRGAWGVNHVCVSPSRAEAMPISLWEALVCGRPAIATDCGAAREWVLEGKTGYLAEGPTCGAIAAALERAWQDRDRWKEMGACANSHCAPLVDPKPGQTLLDLLIEVAE